MDLTLQLRLLGLNRSEITVYLFLLENGLTTPPNVSRGTKIARTNCYNILESLTTKGLIEEQIQGKRKAYISCDPDALLRTLDKKRETVQQILPDLRGLYTTQKNKPKIRFFDGTEQIKEIYRLSLNSQKVLGLGFTEHLNNLMPEFYEWYLHELQSRGIVFYDVLTATSKAKNTLLMEEMLKELYDVRHLPEKYKYLPTNVLIWDDNIALITIEEPIFGTLITNNLLATTFKLIFEIIIQSTI